MNALTQPHRDGRIITFYSFKGGSGRSMSLANTAVLLAQAGLGTEGNHVLLMDWDLEAPGLHEFFKKQLSESDIAEKPGVIDLFTEVKKKFKKGIVDDSQDDEVKRWLAEFMNNAAIKLNLSDNIWLLKAGKIRQENYAHAVQTFDWRAFFDKYYYFFNILIQYLEEQYNFTVIDSRTGFTDVSGICTSILPEALVAVFTPTQQGLRVTEVIEKAVSYRLTSSDLRPLVVYPLASRIDSSVEDLNQIWRQQYTALFEETFKRAYDLESVSLQKYFEKVEIHYVKNYAYGESVAVLEQQGSHTAYELPARYRELQQLISDEYLPWEMPDLPEPRLLTAVDHINFATLLVKNKEIKRAEKHFARAITIDPANDAAYRASINYYELKRDMIQVKMLYEEWVRINEDFSVIYNYTTFLNVQNKHLKVKSVIEEYYKRHQRVVIIDLNYAYALAQLGEYNLAEKLYLDILKINHSSEIKGQYANFLAHYKKDYSKAISAYQEMSKHEKSGETSYALPLAQLHLLNGEKEQGRKYIHLMLKDGITNAHLQALAWHLLLTYFPEEFDNAQQQLEKLMGVGVRFPNRDFSIDIEAAEQNKHPRLEELKAITSELTTDIDNLEMA